MIRKTKELSEDEERNPGRISFEEEKEEGEGKRRRIIFVLFLLTTGLSFLIYLGKQASPKIEEITQPAVFRSSPAFSPSPSPVEKSKAFISVNFDYSKMNRNESFFKKYYLKCGLPYVK